MINFANTNRQILDYSTNFLPEPKRVGFVEAVPLEVVFSFMDDREASKCQRVNKVWNQWANHHLWTVLFPQVAFGKKDWEKHLGGNVGEEPTPPKDIFKILRSACPFFSGRTVRETHLFMLIPEKIDGEPMTLDSLAERAKALKISPSIGYSTPFKMLDCFLGLIALNQQGGNQVETEIEKAIDQYAYQKTDQSRWVLITTTIIPGSEKLMHEEQQKLVASVAQKTKINYEMPKVVEATTCIFMHYVCSKQFILKSGSLALAGHDFMIRCQDKALGKYPIVINTIDSMLILASCRNLSNVHGTAALRKFAPDEKTGS